jgi:4'-phosphopantetheinyl transferase
MGPDTICSSMETIEDIRELPELGKDAIHIWGLHVPDILDRLELLYAKLCVKEQEKALRFIRDADRQSSIAARGALRTLLYGYTGIPSNEIQFNYSGNGKPSLALPPDQQKQEEQDGVNLSFNVSHSGDWVVLAIGRNRNIGVDIEMIKQAMDVVSIASRYFLPEESDRVQDAEDQHAAFFDIWASKEAYVKAAGSALFRELGTFAVPADGGEQAGWNFHRLDAGSQYAAAVVTDQPITSLPCFDFSVMKW